MKICKVNVKIIPEKRSYKVNQKFSLKLRITYKGKRKYYSTGLDANEDEWRAINTADVKGKLRSIKNEIAVIESNAEKCCQSLNPFSFAKFEHEFFDQRIIFNDVKSVYEEYIRGLLRNDQYSTATSYQTSYNSLEKFKKNLQLEEITKEFLQDYEKWLLDNGKSITTVGVYVRPLRAIMNFAKDNGAITQKDYPFGKRKYVIPTGKNIKKALSIQEVKMIFDYHVVPGTMLDRSKDLWIFSYLCNGMNMTDILNLKWQDVDSQTITFEREKTKRTRRGDPIKIIVLRNDYIDRIIEKWCNKTIRNHPYAYVFDILNTADDTENIRKKVQLVTQTTNKWMKRIGEDLNFSLPLTTYVARHTFATILVRSGAPLTFASQSLGHSSIITTQKYFAGFDLRAQSEYVKALINF